MTLPRSSAAARRGAFTLVELLAATAVFIGLMLMLVTATNQTGDIWRRSSTKIEQFQQARRGFESMTRRISQATLNTYWDYHYPLKNGIPDRTQVPDGYERQSELRFRTGQAATLLQGVSDGITRPTHAIFFQAPLGFVDDDITQRTDISKSHKPLNNLLNTWGYFLEVDNDTDQVPQFLKGIISPRMRSRLIEMMEPSEVFKMDNPSQQLVNKPDGTSYVKTMDPNWDNPKWMDWFVLPAKKPDNKRVLTENILALVILPRLSPQDEDARKNASPPKRETLCPFYDYDSKRLSNSRAGMANPLAKASDPELNPKNQLPPVVTVAMIAIDEISAQKLAASTPGDATLGLKISDLFQDSTNLEDDPTKIAQGDGDLAKFEQQLLKLRTTKYINLNYRIFISNVAIRGAKWSRWQQY